MFSPELFCFLFSFFFFFWQHGRKMTVITSRPLDYIQELEV